LCKLINSIKFSFLILAEFLIEYTIEVSIFEIGRNANGPIFVKI